MGCKHKNKLSLYGRKQNPGKWISTEKLCDEMIYVCEDCGAVLRRKHKTIKFAAEDLE